MCQQPDVSLELDHLVTLTALLMDLINENPIPALDADDGRVMTLGSRIHNQISWLSHDCHFLADDIYRKLYPQEGKS